MSKASTPKTRLQRTSNPTPPEPESSKKYIIDMSQNNPEMDFNITDPPIPQQFAIANEDIQTSFLSFMFSFSRLSILVISGAVFSLIILTMYSDNLDFAASAIF
jgi:uncharacterized protein YggU (UPF0235/DUF167 family)